MERQKQTPTEINQIQENEAANNALTEAIERIQKEHPELFRTEGEGVEDQKVDRDLPESSHSE